MAPPQIMDAPPGKSATAFGSDMPQVVIRRPAQARAVRWQPL